MVKTMVKKLLHLIPAALLFFSFSCKTNKMEEKNSSFFQKNEEYFSSIDDFSSSCEEPPAKNTEFFPPYVTQEGVWEVAGVDISEVNPHRKLIALTFDDAPSRTLEGIIATFAAFNEENPDCQATATLFINGRLIDSQNYHLLYAAHTLGFELGNHTHRHADLTTLSQAELQEEIEKTDALLTRVDGQPLHLLRAPYGRINTLVRQTACTPLIDWTIDTVDWTGATAEEIYTRVWEGRFSGAIALLHDGYENTVTALKKLLPALKEDGYQVVSVSKMLKAHGCRFQKGKVYIRARKNGAKAKR